MTENQKWNKKIFSLLLTEARGVRSWRQFASDCGISYAQMRKLAEGSQPNPPRPKLVQKIASNAFGEVDAEDLMFAAGINLSDSQVVKKRASESEVLYKKYQKLSVKDRKIIDSFMDFLLSKNKID